MFLNVPLQCGKFVDVKERVGFIGCKKGKKNSRLAI